MAKRKKTSPNTLKRDELVDLRRAALRASVEGEGKNYRWWALRARTLHFILLYGTMLVLCGALFYIWRAYILKSNWGSLERISVHCESVIKQEEIIKLLNIPEKKNLFFIDTDELEATLQDSPAVKRARVSYQASSSPYLTVYVEARIPVAWVFCSSLDIMPEDYQEGLLIDNDSCIFPCHKGMHFDYLKQNNLPVVQLAPPPSGEFEVATELPKLKPIVSLLELLKAPEIKSHLDSVISVTAPNEWSLQVIFANGTTALFGIYDQERQVESLGFVLEQANRDEKKIKLVNLIPRKNIPIIFE